MKNIIKRFIAVICIIILFIGCAEGWKYILVDDTRSYTRITMHQLYDSSENIDVLFAGSSHVYRSLNPQITDKIFGCNTFNAGTSAQRMDGSLAMIKEAVKYNDIKHIYLELYFGVALDEKFNERTSLTSTYIISDYMKPSFRKIEYLLNASKKDYWVNSFIIARRNWTKFFDSDYVKDLLNKKNSYEYKNYKWEKKEGQAEYYVDKGFVANDNYVPENTVWNANAYGEIAIDKNITLKNDWRKYIQKIINYCDKNDIGLTFYIAPQPQWTLVGKGNYQEYHDLIKKIAKENNILFFDFNLCREEYFDCNDNNLFVDEGHLNTYGADKFSKLFGELFTGQIDSNKVFYDSFDNKLANEEIVVYGIAGPYEESELGIKKCYIIANEKNEIEYKIVKVLNDGQEEVVQEFGKNKEFDLPIGESGTIKILWRNISNADEIYEIECTY